MEKEKRTTDKESVFEAMRHLFCFETVLHIHDCEGPGEICVVFADGSYEYMEIPVEITDWEGEVLYPIQTKWRDATVEDLLGLSPIRARFTDNSPNQRPSDLEWFESELAGFTVDSKHPWVSDTRSNWKYCQVAVTE